MVTIREYKMVESLEEAYELNKKRTNAIIGGMGWIKMQKKHINTAIDLSRLGLDKIVEEEDCFKIGAMVCLRDLETNKAIEKVFGSGIRESLSHIVGIQFRNSATVGGSIRMCFGFSDVVLSLMALGAEVELFEKGIIPLEKYASLPYDNDIVINVILKKEKKAMKYMSLRNSYSDIPILNVAVSKDKNGFSAVVGARPQRAVLIKDTKGILSKEVTEEKAAEFADFVTESLVFGSNMRASKAYREHLSRVLIKRCVLALNGGN